MRLFGREKGSRGGRGRRGAMFGSRQVGSVVKVRGGIRFEIWKRPAREGHGVRATLPMVCDISG